MIRTTQTTLATFVVLVLVLSGVSADYADAFGSESITILNPGFEDPVLADGVWTEDGGPNWSNGVYRYNRNGDLLGWFAPGGLAGVFNPDEVIGYPNGDAFAGQNVGWANWRFFDTGSWYVGLSQVLNATLQADTQYVLGAQIGNPLLNRFLPVSPDYRIELLAGGVLLEFDTGAPPARGMWEHHSLTYDSSVNPAQLGEPLEIRLVAVHDPLRLSGYEVDFDEVTLTSLMTAPTTVPFDIKPGSDPNSVNLKSKGVLPVAVLSTDMFDVSDINVSTLLFGDPLLLDDGGMAASPLRYAYEDVSDDGLLDLTLKFSMRDLVNYDALGLDSIEGLLTGELLDGTPFEGLDSIRIVPPNGSIGSNGNSLQVLAIPEPSTLSLAVILLMGIAIRHRRRV